MTKLDPTWFNDSVPPKPSGKYAHIILLRVTNSYALFQTDGELNTARVRAGVATDGVMTRITIFKRKQTTAERLVGRELLRRYGFTSAELSDPQVKSADYEDNIVLDSNGLPVCDYNVAFCKTCPDCIAYGFAIGDSGSEKSKVITDSAFSLTAYDDSHETMTLNAPYEEGTMSRKGEVTSRINEQDHVKPQVIFPSVVTVRDVTLPLFKYVLQNVVRAKRYGAQTTRTGTMTNHLVGIALTDGEIFSNLHFTQCLYDALQSAGAMRPPDPVDVKAVLQAAQMIIPAMITDDRVKQDQLLTGADLVETLAELPRDDAGIKTLLKSAKNDSRAYFDAYIKKATGATRRGKAR